VGINYLLNRVVEAIVVSSQSDKIEFLCADGSTLVMHHLQDCCESVLIREIAGDMGDLFKHGLPITQAEEVTNDIQQEGTDGAESFRWTFYKLGTVRGVVTITWLGMSNGYYSEAVDITIL